MSAHIKNTPLLKSTFKNLHFLYLFTTVGNRVTVLGIYSIKKSFAQKAGKGGKNDNVGVRAPYMRVIGIEVETDGTGRTSRDLRFTPEEEEEFRRLAARPDIHDVIAR